MRGAGRQYGTGQHAAGGLSAGEHARGPSLAALQAALAAEQAASYGYGVVGSHLAGSPARFDAAAADCVAHERARDSLAAMIAAIGAAPRPAAVAYQLPVTVSTAADAVSLAIILERQVESAYLGMVALPDLALRAFGAGQIRAAAQRSARWSGRSQAFPGLGSGLG